MTDNIKQMLENAESVVSKMRQTGVLDDAGYYMAMICLAHDYFAEGESTTALQFVRRCPESYFDGPFQAQMENDAEFSLMAYILARRIRGMIEVSIPAINGPAAKA